MERPVSGAEPQFPDAAIHWRHRRRLAYWAMTALTVMAALALLGRTPDSAGPLLETIAWVFGFVVGAYYGNNALEAFAHRRPSGGR